MWKLKVLTFNGRASASRSPTCALMPIFHMLQKAERILELHGNGEKKMFLSILKSISQIKKS